jgi:GTP cyclohydrolase II
MDLIDELPDLAGDHYRRTRKPLVILCFAQSLDGSITSQRGTPLQLSSQDSFQFVHRLRAACEAILVGIGTILADDPQLNVRLVSGRHPQPVILDSNLRFPPTARLLNRPGPRPWIFTTQEGANQRQRELEAEGAQVFCLPGRPKEHLDLNAALVKLGELGIRSLMVEGGARVITSFLENRLVDYVVLTLVPVFVGGLRSVENPLYENHGAPLPVNTHGLPHLSGAHYERHGEDLVIVGRLE